MKKYKYLPYNKRLKLESRKMRNEMTAAEKKLWFEYLRLTHYRWLRQKPIGDYIVDFYCSELGLVIEVDGETHLDRFKYDESRTKKLEVFGLKVMRFWNNDVMEGFAEVCNRIEKEIKR